MTQYIPAPHHTELGSLFYDEVTAADFPKTILRFKNEQWAKQVGLDKLTDEEWLHHFGRFDALEDNIEKPLALRYHGHQFRNYNPDLGDGRGFLFAQLRDDKGRLLDLATKGSGQTPWSRAGDGKLTLKGGAREILATEMLEALGCYTSKTFSLIETGEDLIRSDEPSPARSSVLVRLGHSHIRLGTFQRLAAHKEYAALEDLVAYCIKYYWPDAKDAHEPTLAFYKNVIGAVASMGAEWFASGFVHGVLNTDNINITGESFDYGPWRFLPTYQPGFTAAYFDESGLYSFGRQPEALHWNLARLAECLLPLVDQEKLETALEDFMPALKKEVSRKTLARLGLNPEQQNLPDGFAMRFYDAMQMTNTPFEQVFFDLLGGAKEDRIASSPIAKAYEFDKWQDIITELRQAQPLNALPEALNTEYARGSGPQTLLIEEVEALWEKISEQNNWQALDDKVSSIRQAGECYQLLLGDAGVLR